MESNYIQSVDARAAVFEDRDNVRVLLYLYYYNPNVKVQQLEEKLSISQDKLSEILVGLKACGLIKFNENTFELTVSGRNSVKTALEI